MTKSIDDVIGGLAEKIRTVHGKLSSKLTSIQMKFVDSFINLVEETEEDRQRYGITTRSRRKTALKHFQAAFQIDKNILFLLILSVPICRLGELNAAGFSSLIKQIQDDWKLLATASLSELAQSFISQHHNLLVNSGFTIGVVERDRSDVHHPNPITPPHISYDPSRTSIDSITDVLDGGPAKRRRVDDCPVSPHMLIVRGGDRHSEDNNENAQDVGNDEEEDFDDEHDDGNNQDRISNDGIEDYSLQGPAYQLTAGDLFAVMWQVKDSLDCKLTVPNGYAKPFITIVCPQDFALNLATKRHRLPWT